MHMLFVAVGLTVLYALGLVSRPRQLIAAIGPAYLAGVGVVALPLVLLIVLGGPGRLPQLGAIAAILAVAFAAAGAWAVRRRSAPALAEPSDPTPATTWATRAGVAALSLYFAFGASAFAKLPTGNDDWGFWSYKAIALYDYGGKLGTDLLTGGIPGPAHIDYPVLQSLLESLFFRAMGGIYLQEWHIALWIVFAAFVWTAVFLLRSRGVDTLVALAPIGALALTRTASSNVAAGEADVTVACFTAAGALSVGLWLDASERRYALLGGVFLGAAAATKNEGAAAAVAVLLAAAGVLTAARLPRWRVWAIAAAIAAIGAVPWTAWRSAHGVRNVDTGPVSNAVDVGRLTGRLDRLVAAVGKLFAALADQGSWSWIVPCFLVLAGVCVYTGRARREAAFYVACCGLMMLGLCWVYLVGNRPIHLWLRNSAPRVVTGVVFVAAMGAAHLAWMALRPPPRSSPPHMSARRSTPGSDSA